MAHDAAATAAELLGILSWEQLVGNNLNRARFGSGRFEAQEFGKHQHSAASGGAITRAAARVPGLTDDQVAGAFADLEHIAVVLSRGGFGDASDSDVSTWAISQMILGLMQRPHLIRDWNALGGLVAEMLKRQDARSGGWTLRGGELVSSPLFSLYPTLAALAWSRAKGAGSGIGSALRGAAHFHAAMAREHAVPEERAIALGALRHLRRNGIGLTELDDKELERLETAGLEDGYRGDGSSAFSANLTTHAISKPLWYVRFWRPALYLARRHSYPCLEPGQVLLAREVLERFDPELEGWAGPVENAGTSSVSWATALGIDVVHSLAIDIERAGLTIGDWINRAQSLREASYEYDVVISFGGADRSLAATISKVIGAAGFRVFYDYDHQHELLGEDLAVYLQQVYFQKSRFAVALLSPAFLDSQWGGNWEWRAILARMQSSRSSYVLPYFVEDVSVPGLNPTIGFARAAEVSAEEFGQLVVAKLKRELATAA
jgi:hypothetical protein